MSSDENKGENADIPMTAFALMLRKFPVLFSTMRETRKNKNSALESLRTLYQENFGRKTTCSKLLTQIDDMKMKVMEKTNNKRANDKKFNLQSWENIIWQLMDVKSNHNITEDQGAKCLGIPEDDDFEERRPKRIKLSNPLHGYETDETRSLSNEQLQRFISLRQLRVLELEEEKLMKELRK